MALPPASERSVYTVADLRNWAAVTGGLEPTIRLAVFGDPVAHSASPPMHNAALQAHGFAMRYVRIQVRPEELAEALWLAAAEDFVGINLTLPHKTTVLPLLAAVDPHALALGAVNTLRREADGTWRGFNTDGPGFVRAVRAEFGLELPGSGVLILGAAGGAGRALAAECVLAGCRWVALVNRTQSKAQKLAVELAALARAQETLVEAVPWKPVALAAAVRRVDLVVNASSLGLQHSDPSPLTAAQLSSHPAVFDTVYRADRTSTALLSVAQQAGVRSSGGLALLLQQGALSFEHWFGQRAPVEIMRATLEA